MKPPRLLLRTYDQGEILCGALRAILESSFRPQEQLRQEVVAAAPHDALRRDARAPRAAADAFQPDLIFLVLSPDQLSLASQLIASGREEQPQAAIIVVVEECEAVEMLALLQAGASDFITPPLKRADTLPRVWRLLEQARSKESLTQNLKERIGLQRLVGESSKFLSEIKKIPLAARSDGRVLISGETGTGKELCARAIHYLSPRAAHPFVPVNCGAIPVELVENEMFGHERGAFTGAASARPGLIEEAEGGTLFLDEIDCLPLLAQTKLLRFLQEKEYRRLGSSKTLRADVRVITASNIDLEEAVKRGKLRQDLYYRLNVIPVRLPPLRERREDIPLLAQHFMVQYAAEFDKQLTTLSLESIRKLVSYDWPGNVRELEHTIERAVLLSDEPQIGGGEIVLPGDAHASDQESFQQAKAKAVAQFERSYIQQLLLTHQGNISRAAQAARKNRRAFWQLIRKHRIDVGDFKSAAS
ncbi:MAG TPA: sigma 54-interacting transcriptional regulator [Pyrinomonadaceae bacterium]|nr:sigma 54-interacting transcriptional regulator [Pyrinomonadaceae bacterium]